MIWWKIVLTGWLLLGAALTLVKVIGKCPRPLISLPVALMAIIGFLMVFLGNIMVIWSA